MPDWPIAFLEEIHEPVYHQFRHFRDESAFESERNSCY